MATTLKSIRDLIKKKIEGLKDSNGDTIFQLVADYAKGSFESYPVAVILPVSVEGKLISTKQNVRMFNFEVTFYQENTPEGRTAEQANTAMTTAVDAFIQAFDQDKNLNYAVDYIKVVKMDFKFKAPNGPFVFATFQVECEVVVQNYS